MLDLEYPLPSFSAITCPSDEANYRLCIAVDYTGGGEVDILLLNKSPIEPIILLGRLKNEPYVKAVVILADKDSPYSNTVISFISSTIKQMCKD